MWSASSASGLVVRGGHGSADHPGAWIRRGQPVQIGRVARLGELGQQRARLEQLAPPREHVFDARELPHAVERELVEERGVAGQAQRAGRPTHLPRRRACRSLRRRGTRCRRDPASPDWRRPSRPPPAASPPPPAPGSSCAPGRSRPGWSRQLAQKRLTKTSAPSSHVRRCSSPASADSTAKAAASAMVIAAMQQVVPVADGGAAGQLPDQAEEIDAARHQRRHRASPARRAAACGSRWIGRTP